MARSRASTTVRPVAIHSDADRAEGNRPMPTIPTTHDHRRFRLAANDNETVVDAPGMRARVATQGGDDELDTEGHRLAANDNETTVHRMWRGEPGASDDALDAPGIRRIGAR